jgi:4-hydroxy-tetrahydrodipicolinate synthase
MIFKGVYVALVTPFLENGEINEEGFRSNIEFLISKGVSGIIPCGTTGESATLSWDEHIRVVDIAIDQAKKRVSVIAGAGSNNTAESIFAAQHAQEKRADAILCITPYYNRPTQEGLYQHYKLIATKVSLPIVVYNVPSRTGINLLPETLERLCTLDTIAAVKEASGNLLQISEIHRRCGDKLTILSGDDALTLPILAVGGKGVVSVTGNIVPDKIKNMIDAFFANDMAKAIAIHEELLPLSNALFLETNPIPVKTAMNLIGVAAGALRLPLVTMGDRNKQKLIDVLTAFGLL